MAMMILPLPHYENFCWKFFAVGKKNVSESKILASRSSAETFCPPKQTPWRRPWPQLLSRKCTSNDHKFYTVQNLYNDAK